MVFTPILKICTPDLYPLCEFDGARASLFPLTHLLTPLNHPLLFAARLSQNSQPHSLTPNQNTHASQPIQGNAKNSCNRREAEKNVLDKMSAYG